MERKLGDKNLFTSQTGNNKKRPCLESGSDDSLSQFGQVVSVSPCNLFDQTVNRETFQDPGDGSRTQVGDELTDHVVLKTTYVELSPGENFKKLLIGMAEKVETLETSVILLDRFGDFIKLSLGSSKVEMNSK